MPAKTILLLSPLVLSWVTSRSLATLIRNLGSPVKVTCWLNVAVI